MKLWVALLLADCVFVGIGLTYLTGIKFRVEERFAYGAVLGFAALTLLGYTSAWAVGNLNGQVILGVAVSATALSIAGWRVGASRFIAECCDFSHRLRLPISQPENPVPLLVLTTPSWAIATWILHRAYLPDGTGGVLAGHLSSWTDWQVHLTYASSFAHAENFPPTLPTAIGIERLPYHFGIDFFAAMLDQAGLSAFGGIEVSSGYLAFAFVPVMYLAGTRLFDSRAVGAMGVLVFGLLGGLGWTNLFSDIADRGWSVIWNLPTDYTRHHTVNILLENAVTGNLFPQRPTLAGFSLLLIVIVLLHEAHLSGSRHLFAIAGFVVGLMPVFHVYSFGVALGLGLIWALLDRRWQWLLFGLPAVVFSLPAALWIRPFNTEIVFEQWVNGPWMQAPTYSMDQDTLFSFWWRNAGVFLGLMLVAQFWRDTLPRIVLWGSVPLWLWFVVPNFVRVAPSHPWNNTHWFVPMLLLGAFLVASVLVRLAAVGLWGKVGSITLLLTLTLAGALDIYKAVDPEVDVWPHPIASADGVAAGLWARDNTPVDSVFLVGFEHTHPVPALSGRQIVVGFAGWINDLGVIDWHQRQQQALMMLRGSAGTPKLLDALGVNYVVVGPIEQRALVNRQYWAERGTLVFKQGEYSIYEVA
ncbi:MAG: hypothetical protein F4138_07315 [Acidimicrobiia bacterium]|nr:hypothetical protein [Acidimicrobiia bacterium]